VRRWTRARSGVAAHLVAHAVVPLKRSEEAKALAGEMQRLPAHCRVLTERLHRHTNPSWFARHACQP
jgi:hypothetical protein